jgi:hypothetical protein
MGYGKGYDSDSDSDGYDIDYGGAIVGGKFTKGKKLSYKDYLKMWKSRHKSSKGAKEAFKKLRSKKTTTKKTTTKCTKKKGVKIANKWIMFLKKNGGKNYTRKELQREYKKNPSKKLPKKK